MIITRIFFSTADYGFTFSLTIPVPGFQYGVNAKLFGGKEI
jgi:hypothetical protein